MSEVVGSTTPRREATRQRLLDAAAQVFAEVGLDGASVETVCERAGYTRGAFYSNFESKEELFLELARRVVQHRVCAARSRVAELGDAETASDSAADAFTIIQRVLDASADERLGVLLMSEIRIHALRNPVLAEAYLAQEEQMIASVASIVEDAARAHGLALRIPADEAARLIYIAWDGSSVRAVMAGLDAREAHRRTSVEIGRLAQLLIEAPAP